MHNPRGCHRAVSAILRARLPGPVLSVAGAPTGRACALFAFVLSQVTKSAPPISGLTV
jgi:hypothetical protein